MNYAIPNVILIGAKGYPLYRFDNRSIVLNSLNGVFSVDTVGNELSVDTFTVTIRYDPTPGQVYAPVDTDGYLTTNPALYGLHTVAGREYMTELPYGTPVYWYCDGEFFSKGYLQSCDRIGKYAWKLTAISGIGLLSDTYHPGGIYTGETVAEIAADIIGDVFPYTIDEAVASVTVNGWLPYDTRRKNLHRLLFAVGASVVRGDVDIDYNIAFLRESASPPVIPDSRIALGGKVSYTLPATAAEISEHSFFPAANTAPETLYDNTATVSGSTGEQTIIFSNPYYDLAVTGTLTIVKSGANFAVVTGQGVLTGKKYTHTQQIVTESGADTGKPLVKRVTDNYLITALNSRNVAKRVLAFYSSAKAVSARLIQKEERCGAPFSFNDPFSEATAAFLQKMTVKVTSIKAAQCEFIEGYTPTGQGNYYNNRVLISASGTWTAPAGVTRIRLVLVGGGSGGSGGYDGAHGEGGAAGYGGQMTFINNAPDDQGYIYANGEQGIPQGGAEGSAGSAGAVFILDLNIENGETFSFNIGSAGAGGAANGGAGTAGTKTSVISDSITGDSDDGTILPSGFLDPFTLEVYGAPGEVGHAGGNGGQTDIGSLYSSFGMDGYPGGSSGEYAGGAGGIGQHADAGDVDPNWPYAPGYVYFYVSGGGGGGAAHGSDGEAGGAGEWVVTESYSSDYPQGGKGGDGADASTPITPNYGGGGGGGNGGGAGGNAGGSRSMSDFEMIRNGRYRPVVNNGGEGGKGSPGGNGGAGCAIIYY